MLDKKYLVRYQYQTLIPATSSEGIRKSFVIIDLVCRSKDKAEQIKKELIDKYNEVNIIPDYSHVKSRKTLIPSNSTVLKK